MGETVYDNESAVAILDNLMQIIRQGSFSVTGENIPVVSQVLTDATQFTWALKDGRVKVESTNDTNRPDND